MSDSDEIIASGSESDESDSDVPNEEITIEGSSTDSENDHIVLGGKRNNNIRRAVIDSDTDDDEEEEFERQVISPRTRMSITGIRPNDLSDSDDDLVEDDEVEKINKSEQEQEDQSEQSSSKEYTLHDATGSGSNEESATEPNQRNTFLDQSADEKSTLESSISNKSSSVEEVSDETPDKALHVGRRSNHFNHTPLISPRYSEHFENAIKEKLSSTIYQPRTQANNSGTDSDDSDLQIISRREKPIEILSSDDDEVISKSNTTASHSNIADKTKTGFQQPKLTSNFPTVPRGAIPKNTKVLSKHVSKEFYDKEVKKLNDLKMELLSAENLMKMSSNLPDDGRLLRKRIQSLCSELETKAKYVISLVIEDSKSPLLQQQLAKKPLPNNIPPSWDELSAAVNQIKPLHTGKQGMATFNNQKEMTVERLKDIHSSLKSCPADDVLADDPKGLKIALMPHQKHALAWIDWREKQKPCGGILADDMGLGKTLTMISAVLAAKNLEESNGNNDVEESDSDNEHSNGGWSSKGRKDYYAGGTLVVCPASLLRQWEGEVESKIKRQKITVCVHHGNNRDTKPRHLRTYDIVVTTYQIVAREEKSNGALFGIKWKRIILDEAHVVRNPKAQSSIAVCKLRAKYRWALTGTPIQNKEMDMYALLKFLRCSPFDDMMHWKKWIDNKSAGGQQRLNTLMKSLMLRRTKIQLQERGELQCLPDKRIELIEVNLDKDEMNVYQKIMLYSRTMFAQFLLQRADREAINMFAGASNNAKDMLGGAHKNDNGMYYKIHQKFTKLHNGNRDIKSHEILVLLLRLRQICCHPGLIDAMLEDEDSQAIDSDSDNGSKEQFDLLEQLNRLTITDGKANVSAEADESARPEDEAIAKASAKVLLRTNPVFNLKRPSSKMQKVMETLQKCILRSNDKAIIVSQWTSVLNILKTHLASEGIITLSLDGSIPVSKRQEIVNQFNNSENNKRILLLSLTAGGVGLNLIGGNHLLLIDLHWNPQLEAQAQDRIYRVGQKKNVIIYKFMCKDTVEERIKALQDKKIAIADGVLTGSKSEGSKLTMDDLKGLFGL